MTTENIEAIFTVVFNIVFWPTLYRLWTYPRILSYDTLREREPYGQGKGLVKVEVVTFWGKRRRAYSDDEGGSFFWPNGELAYSIRDKYWIRVSLDKRKEFLIKEGLFKP